MTILEGKEKIKSDRLTSVTSTNPRTFYSRNQRTEGFFLSLNFGIGSPCVAQTSLILDGSTE